MGSCIYPTVPCYLPSHHDRVRASLICWTLRVLGGRAGRGEGLDLPGSPPTPKPVSLPLSPSPPLFLPPPGETLRLVPSSCFDLGQVTRPALTYIILDKDPEWGSPGNLDVSLQFPSIHIQLLELSASVKGFKNHFQETRVFPVWPRPC